MKPRQGATLIEVLVAIFVMAIGLLTLLALFPLGALSMAQAIRDDRAGHSSKNATAIATILGVPKAALQPVPYWTATGGFFKGPVAPDLADLATAAGYSGPGYPIFVDPYGTASGYSARIGFLAGAYVPTVDRPTIVPPRQDPNASGFPRVTFTAAPDFRRWFSLLDDLNFEANGLPYPGNPGAGANAIERDYRYTWAYLLRMKDFNPPPLGGVEKVETTVITYSARPVVPGETTFRATYNFPTSNTVRVYWTGDKPAIRKGQWVLDATMPDQLKLTIGMPPAVEPKPQGYFYRVVNVTEPVPGQMDLELQNTLQMTAEYDGVLVVMEGVVDHIWKDQIADLDAPNP